MIIGGPNKYYEYSEKNIKNIFTKVQKIIENNDLTLIVIPSMRTPKKVIDLALNYFDNKHLIIKDIDKKAYLSALSIAKYIIVTCDSLQ